MGRYVYGLAAIGFGICAVVWHDISNLQQFATLGSGRREILAEVVAAIEILGGLALLGPATARAGAIALALLYGAFAVLGLPYVVAQPAVYNNYGNVFEQLSLAVGGAILASRTVRIARIAAYTFGACTASFALEQWFYLAPTAGLVPKWIPPGQLFWAVATTVAFALAAIAMLTGVAASLAARLTAAMIAGFGLLVWLPALVANPRSFANWSEALETFAIAATAGMVARLAATRSGAPRSD
jgi:uncharacterized membrane protein YphA (DoxX/SURF4 family)